MTRIVIIIALLVSGCARQEAMSFKPMNCTLLVETTNGSVCIHPDGNVTLPKKGISVTSREFWYELSRVYLQVKGKYCI